jgi:hypothetical protein
MIYVLRNGKLIPKYRQETENKSAYISRFQSYESPIDDKTISSHRQRDVDMHKSNSYDLRDIGPNHEFTRAKQARKEYNERPKPGQLDFWRDPD